MFWERKGVVTDDDDGPSSSSGLPTKGVGVAG